MAVLAKEHEDIDYVNTAEGSQLICKIQKIQINIHKCLYLFVVHTSACM